MIPTKDIKYASRPRYFSRVTGDLMAKTKDSYGISNSSSFSTIFSLFITSEPYIKTDNVTGPSGFEPETAGFLPRDKSPVLYLAELRAHISE